VSSDDADIEPWIHISGRISECAELIKVEELTKSHKDEELRALVESTISEVSNFFDASLLLYLQNKDDLFKSLNHYLPYRGQTWYEFVEDKTPYYQDNGKPAELGLKYLEAFKTVAGRFQDEINRALNYQPPSMKTTRMTRVFYVTDRRKIRGVLNRYTLLYGFEDVSIPVKHTRGKVETPNILRGANDKFHVRIKGGKTIGRKPIFLTAIKKDGLLLYIHGFKTSPELAIRCAAQLKYDLDFEGDVLAYCWPSEGTYWGYFKDGTAVVETALNLGRVITTLLNGKVPFHILAHSMGNRALIKALTTVMAPQQESQCKNVILAAADEQRCKFEDMLKVMYPKDQSAKGSVSNKPKGPLISVYSSANDWALIVSETINGEIRLGNTFSLLERNEWEKEVDVVDASGVPCAGSQHSYHAEVWNVLDDIQHLLKNLTQAEDRAKLDPSVIKEVRHTDTRTFHAFKKDWWTPERFDKGHGRW